MPSRADLYGQGTDRIRPPQPTVSSQRSAYRRPSTAVATWTTGDAGPCGSLDRSFDQSRMSTIVRPRDQLPDSSTRSGKGDVVRPAGSITAQTAPPSPMLAPSDL